MNRSKSINNFHTKNMMRSIPKYSIETNTKVKIDYRLNDNSGSLSPIKIGGVSNIIPESLKLAEKNELDAAL